MISFNHDWVWSLEKLGFLPFLCQKRQTYRFDGLKFIPIYANWKWKEWNVQEHKKDVGHPIWLYIGIASAESPTICWDNLKEFAIIRKNIATGKASQVITFFHFFGFYPTITFITVITIYILSHDNFYHWISSFNLKRFHNFYH